MYYIQNIDDGQVLVTALVSPSTESDSEATKAIPSRVTDADLSSIKRPAYLSDLQSLQDSEIDIRYSVDITQKGKNESGCVFWLGAGPDCSEVYPRGTLMPSSDMAACSFSAYKERRATPSEYFDSGKLLSFTGATHEWTVYGEGSAFHPLHLHVHSFQIISTSSVQDSEDFYRVGQWRDTIPPVATSAVIRFRSSGFTGVHVFHCHFAVYMLVLCRLGYAR